MAQIIKDPGDKKALKAELKARGLRLRDAAAAMHLTPQKLSKILVGERHAQHDEIVRLSVLLEVDATKAAAFLGAPAPLNYRPTLSSDQRVAVQWVIRTLTEMLERA